MKTNEIVVQRFTDVRSDLGICDVARVSMAKSAYNFTDEENTKLLRYLAKNKHWSPFGHARVMVRLKDCTPTHMADFWLNAELAGFTWGYSASNKTFMLNGSVWAFYENIQHIPMWARLPIIDAIEQHYPRCHELLFQDMVNDEKWKLAHWSRVELVRQEELQKVAQNAKLHYQSFRFQAPIFVARQLVKHQIGFCWNEESRRYIEEEPVFYDVVEWRGRPIGSIKQGSSGIVELLPKDDEFARFGCHEYGKALYNVLLSFGVAPELARTVLSQAMQVEWIWTGHLAAWKRMCNLRLDPHAQKEARAAALPVDTALRELYPGCWDSIEA